MIDFLRTHRIKDREALRVWLGHRGHVLPQAEAEFDALLPRTLAIHTQGDFGHLFEKLDPSFETLPDPIAPVVPQDTATVEQAKDTMVEYDFATPVPVIEVAPFVAADPASYTVTSQPPIEAPKSTPAMKRRWTP